MESKFKIFAELVTRIVKSIHEELGAGFTEDVYQNAFAIELRKYEINYFKEFSFEIFYKEYSVGLARLDFFINDKKLPNFIIETKSLQCLNDAARTQLYRYLLSSKLNADPELKKTNYGVLINWPGAKVDSETQVIFNKEPEVEFYMLKNEKVQRVEMEVL